jgi:hypothetical protein
MVSNTKGGPKGDRLCDLKGELNEQQVRPEGFDHRIKPDNIRKYLSDVNKDR